MGSGRVKHTGAFKPAYPDIILLITFNGVNSIVIQGGTVANNISEHAEPIAIIAVQPIVGAKPHTALVILIKCNYDIIRQALVNTEVFDRIMFCEQPRGKQ